MSLRRDRHLADARLCMVTAWCLPLAAVLVLTDGWAASPNSIRRAFREKVKGVIGRGGRRWLAWPTVVIGTVITQTAKKRVVEVIRRLTQGDAWAAVAVLCASAGGTPVNTSFSERVHATCRERLASLTRRCRHAARTVSRLEAGMWLVGWTSTCCWPHHEVSRRAARAQACRGAVPITPAMASGLTNPVWSVRELLTVRVPPPAWVEPTRRRRPRTKGAPGNTPAAARRHPLLRLRKGVLCSSTREGSSTGCAHCQIMAFMQM